jgi:hypothetical protein
MCHAPDRGFVGTDDAIRGVDEQTLEKGFLKEYRMNSTWSCPLCMYVMYVHVYRWQES